MNKKLLISQKRTERDISKLIKTGYKLTRSKINPNELTLQFKGPKNTLYSGGEWPILIHLPQEYPYKSPSIGFLHKIYHPNIDFSSGSICLDVINQTWSPMYELVNIFEIFLPQLLLYPNPSDPLNIEAAELLNNNVKEYEHLVKKMVKIHASRSREGDIERGKRGEEEGGEEGGEEGFLDFSLSGVSGLSDLSETSGIFLEDDLFF